MSASSACNQIVRFDYRQGRPARARPADRGAARHEAAAAQSEHRMPRRSRRRAAPLAGTLIAISERGLDTRRQHLMGFLIGGAERRRVLAQAHRRFRRQRLRASRRTASCWCWSGASHGRAAWRSASAACRLPTIKPGALVDGPELIFADMGYQIDNMEGLSVHRDAAGALVLTLISDDNFSPLQRTMLLQFTLVGPSRERIRADCRASAANSLLECRQRVSSPWPASSRSRA